MLSDIGATRHKPVSTFLEVNLGLSHWSSTGCRYDEKVIESSNVEVTEGRRMEQDSEHSKSRISGFGVQTKASRTFISAFL